MVLPAAAVRTRRPPTTATASLSARWSSRYGNRDLPLLLLALAAVILTCACAAIVAILLGYLKLPLLSSPSSKLLAAERISREKGGAAVRSKNNNNEDDGPGSPFITLRDTGLRMPALGYGTCCRKSAKGEAIERSTLIYLSRGGRLVDTAMAYGNHVEIGSAVHKSKVPRSEVWLTSKVSPNRVKSYDETLAAVDNILSELQTDYLDLLLIHSPKLGKARTVELWRGLIEAKRIGKVRAIGVSNFNQPEIEDLFRETDVMPEANEIQYHPWSPPEWKAHVSWCKSRGIAVIAYTSLGGQRFRREGSKWPAVVRDLAGRHGVTEAQVLLRWSTRQGVAVIPGATSEEHIAENLNIPSTFDLTDDEALAIERAAPPKAWFDPARGPAKMSGADAKIAWGGDGSKTK